MFVTPTVCFKRKNCLYCIVILTIRMKERILMRRNLILGAFSIVLLLCIVACSNTSFVEHNAVASDASYKINQIIDLFKSYGWKLDTTINEAERNRLIEKMNYNDVKAFLEDMKKGSSSEPSDSVKMRYCRRCID